MCPSCSLIRQTFDAAHLVTNGKKVSHLRDTVVCYGKFAVGSGGVCLPRLLGSIHPKSIA